eukprot:2556678-Amphidinium_carterae.1
MRVDVCYRTHCGLAPDRDAPICIGFHTCNCPSGNANLSKHDYKVLQYFNFTSGMRKPGNCQKQVLSMIACNASD